jgi:26S proteasome regulatory subunit N12
MSELFEQAKSLYLSAQKSLESEKLAKCEEELGNLRIALIKCTSFLPESGQGPSVKEHVLTRDSLELGVFYSIAKRDIDAFERFMVQLKPYYHDFKNGANESPYTEQMIGLHLLFLLAKNRIGEFHAELEKLPADKIESSHYLQHPIQLEQSLMEGNYSKVFLARANIPAAQYRFFMDELASTIRSEIADCMDASFVKSKSIASQEMARLLHFPAVNAEFKTFVSSRSSWSITGSNVSLKAGSENKMVDEEDNNNAGGAASGDFESIDTKETTNSMIDYAKEMEVII